MALEHRSWRLDLLEAKQALDGLVSLSDVLSPRLTDLARRVRDDPMRRNHLQLARMDPLDRETWNGILDPADDDFGLEQAAAARLMIALIDVCTPAGGLQTRGYFVEELLYAAGWKRPKVSLALRGVPLESFFETHAAWLAGIAQESKNWFQGGWLDAISAQALRHALSRDAAVLDERMNHVAFEQSYPTGLSELELTRILRWGLHDLETMLAAIGEESALWIIQD